MVGTWARVLFEFTLFVFKWRVHVAGFFHPSFPHRFLSGRWSRVGDVTVIMPLDFDSIEASPYNHLRLLFFHYCQSRAPRRVGRKQCNEKIQVLVVELFTRGGSRTRPSLLRGRSKPKESIG